MEYWYLFIGHLTGDYLCQNNWMALNKKKNNLTGWLACLTHCILYTLSIIFWLSICGYQNRFNPLFILLIFLSHFIIDKTYIIEIWMETFKKNTWYSNLPLTFARKKVGGTNRFDLPYINWKDSIDSEILVTTIFGAFIQIVCDNTLHLILMTLILKFYMM